jgi:hypothetical protein
LQDEHLLEFSVALQSLPAFGTFQERYQTHRHLQARWTHPQRMLQGLGIVILSLMLLCPPWSRTHHRFTWWMGAADQRELMDRHPLGYHWVWTQMLPIEQRTLLPTYDLQRSQWDIHQSQIDYGRLSLQGSLWLFVIQIGIWFVRRIPNGGTQRPWRPKSILYQPMGSASS